MGGTGHQGCLINSSLHTCNRFKNRATVSSYLGKFINDCGWLSTSPINKLMLKIDRAISEQGIKIPSRKGRLRRKSQKCRSVLIQDTAGAVRLAKWQELLNTGTPLNLRAVHYSYFTHSANETQYIV